MSKSLLSDWKNHKINNKGWDYKYNSGFFLF